MKELEIIKKSITSIPKGRPFMASSLASSGSYVNVRQTLSRLVAAGEIMRAARGVYVRPNMNPYLGVVLPPSEEIIKILAKQTGEIVTIHGAEAVRQLQLSTQVPVRPVFNTSGTSRQIKIGKQIVTLKHISPRKLVQPGTMTCTVISALWYLGKNNVYETVVNKIKQKLTEQQFAELLKNTHKMPRWMSSAFQQYKK